MAEKWKCNINLEAQKRSLPVKMVKTETRKYQRIMWYTLRRFKKI